MLWSAVFFGFLYTVGILSGILILFLVKHAFSCYMIYGVFKRNGISGPRPIMFFGNCWEIWKYEDPNQLIERWLKTYGDIFGYFVGSVPHLIVNDVDIVKEIMVRQNKLFRNRNKLVLNVEPLCHSLFAAEDENWLTQRRVITPAFSPSKIKHMSSTINSCVDVFLEEISKVARENEDFNICEHIQALSLEVIGKTALAMDIGCQRDLKNTFYMAVKEYFEMCQNAAVKAAVLFPIFVHIFTFINNYLSAGKMTDIIVTNLKRIVKMRRQNREKRIDLLQLMLDSADESGNVVGLSKSRIDDNCAKANAYFFLLAGYETTSTALGFTFYLLAKHSEIQERLYLEVVEHLADVQDPSYEDVMGLPYLDQVLNESMRIYPPVTLFLTRTCTERQEVNGLVIPEGVTIQVPVWHIHHDPSHYPKPWSFDPDRFSTERKEELHPAAFLPFGIGPRNCIGMKFALLEAKLALVKVVKSLQLHLSERSEDPLILTCPTVISYPKNGIYLEACPR